MFESVGSFEHQEKCDRLAKLTRKSTLEPLKAVASASCTSAEAETVEESGSDGTPCIHESAPLAGTVS